MTNPFREIASAAEDKNLEFLLIGGHAVNAWGYERTTVDIDLLVSEADLAHWKGILSRLGYTFGHETDAFVQFVEPEGSVNFPIDLMVVGSDTFQKLMLNAAPVEFGEVTLKLPRVLDLIALKLHALRSETRSAMGKDLPDILALIDIAGLKLSDPDLSAIVDKHASEKTKAELRRRLLSD